MSTQRYFRIFISSFFILCFAGCGSAKKSLFSTDDAKKAVTETSQAMKMSQRGQVDLLANEEYQEARKLHLQSKKDLNQNDPEKVIEKAHNAKNLFHKASLVADSRKANHKRILKARYAALKAGVKRSRKLKKSLYEIDEDLRDETDEFSKNLEPDEYSEFQKKYLKIEAKAVQNIKLGKARKVIRSGHLNHAKKLAPKTFREAKMDLKDAENIIMRSPRNKRVYSKRVKKANTSTTLLKDVLKAIEEGGQGTSEAIALRIVKQERKLGSLNSDIGKLKGDLSTTKSNLNKASITLASKDAELKKTSTYVHLQKAMDDVRKNFSEDEAEVYQQGKKLIIRLKKINFSPGRSSIPEESVRLLSKVSSIVKELNPSEVIVQGHTDSSGSKTTNRNLSRKRANSVATYLSANNASNNIIALGFGDSKPIASNSTSKGRSINRRVDIIARTRETSSIPQSKLTGTKRKSKRNTP